MSARRRHFWLTIGPMGLHGRTIAIRGNVDCVEDVLIEGRIEGNIWNEHHAVTVGADAVVKGDIVARIITVRGEMDGLMMASGRVDIMDAEALVTATEHGEVLERNARGRVGFPSEVQAAMVFVHGQRPGLRISEVRPIDSHRVSPALTSVRLAVGEEIVDIQVEAESSPIAWLTCQAGQPSSASVYRVLAMDVVSTTR